MSPSCNRPVDGSLPPSPAEQRRSQRLSWGSLLQKLGELKGNNQRAAAGRLSSSSSQTGESSPDPNRTFVLGFIHSTTSTAHKIRAFIFKSCFVRFRLCCRHVPAGVRELFLVLPPGGDPGSRGRPAHQPEPAGGVLQPGLLQTPLPRPPAPQHQPGAAASGLQRALRPQGGSGRPVVWTGGTQYCLSLPDSNTSGAHPRSSAPSRSDPGSEAGCQRIVAEGSEALQGQRFPPGSDQARQQSEAEHQLQGNQEETVQLRGAAHRGVLLSQHPWAPTGPTVGPLRAKLRHL
ncbi:unnamed protein product [Tetraodon nigroviridis]|uniref:(spotted green pufferfish) hypothetical protein n=1 Tax=Tetraodon nigroviridis TaxID=99883 RepID=Q4SL33_TETNG|nr:unnamed protein product [Tetraodon nigroviridis]